MPLELEGFSYWLMLFVKQTYWNCKRKLRSVKLKMYVDFLFAGRLLCYTLLKAVFCVYWVYHCLVRLCNWELVFIPYKREHICLYTTPCGICANKSLVATSTLLHYTRLHNKSKESLECRETSFSRSAGNISRSEHFDRTFLMLLYKPKLNT